MKSKTAIQNKLEEVKEKYDRQNAKWKIAIIDGDLLKANLFQRKLIELATKITMLRWVLSQEE